MYSEVNLPRHAKSKREVSKKGCVKGIQGRRDAGNARNIIDVIDDSETCEDHIDDENMIERDYLIIKYDMSEKRKGCCWTID